MTFFTNIALRDGYEIRYLMMNFLKYLKKKHNSKIYIYGSENAKIFYNEMIDEKIIDSFIICDHLHKNLFKKIENPNDVIRQSKVNENFIKSSYNILRMTRRDLGLGFYSGARYHPQSPASKETNYLQIVNAYNSLISFWINEIKKKKLKIFFNGLKDEEFVCKSLGVEFRVIEGSRLENYWHWNHGLRGEFPGVKYYYNKLKKRNFEATNLKSQYYQDRVHKKLIFSKSPVQNFLEKVFFQTKKSIYNFNNKKKYYYFSYIKYLYNQYRHTKLLKSSFVHSIETILDKKFVYFPLHTEPEASLHWVSPECFNQIDVIMSLSRDLPSDTYLVVKETIYGVGGRNRDFYNQIKNLKNTILVNITSDSLRIIKNCMGVAVVSGTAGVEAAMMGKPVLLFSKNSFYDFLPHVFKVSTNDINYELIKKVSDQKFKSNKTMNDGSRLKQAIIDASFDMKDFTNLHREQFDQDVLSVMYKGLKNSLEKNFSI